MTGTASRAARIAVNLLHVVPGEVGGSEEYAERTLSAYARHGSPDLVPVLYVLAPFVAVHRPLCEAFDTVISPLDGATEPDGSWPSRPGWPPGRPTLMRSTTWAAASPGGADGPPR